MEENLVNWFEIPVADFNRARKFYEALFEKPVYVDSRFGETMGFLPMTPQSQGVGGAITLFDDFKPSGSGVIVYLNGGNDLTPMLNRVEPAGGRVTIPKTKITDEIGYYAGFTDSEGNHIRIHSRH